MTPRPERVLCAMLLAASAAAGSGCGGGPCGRSANQLSGSIGQLYDIASDDVRARKVDETHVTLEFRHGNDVVAKIVSDVRGFSKGARIPLNSGDVYRVTSPATEFPGKIERGSILYESDLVAGSEVSACFDVLFGESPDHTQRTLAGAVQAVLLAPVGGR